MIKGSAGWEIGRELVGAGIKTTPYPNDAELLIFDNERLARSYCDGRRIILLISDQNVVVHPEIIIGNA